MKKSLPGFALLEATMALIVLGIIASFTFPMITSLMEYERTKRTADHREHILRALAGYAIIHGRLPAPAKPGIQTFKNCEGTKCIGLVPYHELGIPQKLAKDGHGHWFTYVVHSDMTSSKEEKEAGYPLSYLIKPETHFINLKDIENQTPIYYKDDNKNPIAIVLISHGPSGAGAFYEDGITKMPTSNKYEAINAAEDLNFVTGNAENYNHQVFWMAKNQFLTCYLQNLIPLYHHKYEVPDSAHQPEDLTIQERKKAHEAKLKQDRARNALKNNPAPIYLDQPKVDDTNK